MSIPIAVVDFFSGCGGTALGFRDAGLSIVAAVDNDPNAANTYRHNFPEATFIERDIRDVSAREIKKTIPSDVPLLLSGCAPCQPFSKQNRARDGDDPRRFLLAEFQRFVVALRPDFVVVENVPGLQKIGDEGPFRDFLRVLAGRGYDIFCHVLAAQQFGVPQVRRRLLLVASLRTSAPVPQPTHGPGFHRLTTVRDLIGDLPPIAAGETDLNDPDHAAMSLSPLNLKRIMATIEGKGRESWRKELLLECHQGHDGHSDVYGRLAWDKPAAAITTRCLSYSNGRFGHPEQHRAISLREAACLQTFPRWFRFSGTLTSRGRQVGNAVPPILAQQVGKAIAANSTGSRRRRKGPRRSIRD